MKVFRIRRVTPTTGVIEILQWDGKYLDYSPEMKYSECRTFIANNQREIKTYRIAEYANRKDALRHLQMTIYANDETEAIGIFCDVDLFSPKRRRELLSGDWKIITKNY